MNRVMDAYADMVRRICFVHLKDRHDTEDVFQNVYMKYLLYEGSFESSEHEKAWFARVTINACTDWMRALSRRKWVSLDALSEERAVLDESSNEVRQHFSAETIHSAAVRHGCHLRYFACRDGRLCRV